MQPDSIPYRPAIMGLAYAAGASVGDCLRRGAKWTLLRMLERRNPIVSILVIRRLGGDGIAYGKGVVGWATEERVRALGEAIDAADPAAALGALDRWLVGEHAANERLVHGLMQAFGHE